MPGDCRSVISIELTLVSNEISLSLAPRGFLATRFGPSNRWCRAYFQTKSLRQMRQKMLYGRVGFNRSVEKLRNSLLEIGRRRIPGCDSPNRISNYLNRCAVGVRGSGTSSGASASLHDIFPRDLFRFSLQRGSNYRYKMTQTAF